MRCNFCLNAITQVEADRAAEVSPIIVTLCLRCAEAIASAYNDEDDDCLDTDSDSQERWQCQQSNKPA